MYLPTGFLNYIIKPQERMDNIVSLRRVIQYQKCK